MNSNKSIAILGYISMDITQKNYSTLYNNYWYVKYMLLHIVLIDTCISSLALKIHKTKWVLKEMSEYSGTDLHDCM